MYATSGRDLGLLVVGVGSFGARRAAAATVSRGVQLVAVADRDAGLVRRVADLHGAAVAADLRDGLALRQVDAVVIATPPADHAAQVRLALMAGKHVLCESPLAIDPSEARDLAELARACRLRLATGFPHRFDPPVRDVIAVAGGGAIGRVEQVRVRIGHRAGPDTSASWHAGPVGFRRETLLEAVPHACDLIRRLLGEVELIEASFDDRNGQQAGSEPEAHVRVEGRDGGRAELWSSWTPDANTLALEVLGTRGQLRVEMAPWRLSGTLGDGSPLRRRYVAAGLQDRLHRRWFRCERTLARELEAFAAAPLNPRQLDPLGTAWDGCRVCEMVHAALTSARQGGPVRLDPPPVSLPSVTRRLRDAWSG